MYLQWNHRLVFFRKQIESHEKQHTSNKLIPKHLQVFFHSTEKSIVDIRLIDVLQEIPNGSKGENERIDFEKKPSLIWGEVPRIPYVAFP